MARSSTRPLVDRIIPGGLDAFLTAARAADETVADITFRLRAEHDIKLSEETVRRWVADIDAEAVR